ncbi:MAG: hypothetical protein LDL38_02965, partial [Flavobacterium piscis]|nr:hypothetical protein [Flavobacterium piscis]
MNKYKEILAFFQKKYVRITFKIILYGFAAYGFILTAAYFAVKLHLTDDPGVVDKNDRYFQEMAEKYKKNNGVKYKTPDNEAVVYNKIAVLHQYAPLNANLILHTFNKTKNVELAQRMFDAVNVHLQNNKDYLRQLEEADKLKIKSLEKFDTNLFSWMNMEEWRDYKIIMKKEYKLLDSVGRLTGVEPRLIA